MSGIIDFLAKPEIDCPFLARENQCAIYPHRSANCQLGYLESVKASLGFRAKGRDVIQSGEGYQLRESPAPYKVFFQAENEDIDPENTVFRDVKDV